MIPCIQRQPFIKHRILVDSEDIQYYSFNTILNANVPTEAIRIASKWNLVRENHAKYGILSKRQNVKEETN
jgi:hypothetical protein